MAPSLVGIERLDLARPDAWVNAVGYQGIAERVGDDPDRLARIRQYAAELWADANGLDGAVSTPVEAPEEPVTQVLTPVVPAFGAEPVAAALRLPAAEPVTDVLAVVPAAADEARPDWANEPTAALPVQRPFGKIQAFWLAHHKIRQEDGWSSFLSHYGENWNTALRAGRLMRGVNPETGRPYPVPVMEQPAGRAARIARATLEGMRRNKAALILGACVVAGVVGAFLGGPSEAGDYIPAKFDLGGISNP